MAETMIDGVAVNYSSDGDPDAPVAELTFTIPADAETPDLIGLTHLVWALAMAGAGLVLHTDGTFVGDGIDVDVLADSRSVQFCPDGNPEAVYSFLTALCEAFRNPPVGLLADVAAELDPADASDFRQDQLALLAMRYGRAGLGLAYWPGPGYLAFIPDQVRAHAQRVFTAQNAVLDTDAPVPDGVRLPLPSNTDRRVAPVPPARIGHPMWSGLWGASAGVIVRTSQAPATSIAMGILQKRLKSLDDLETDYADAGTEGADWLLVSHGKTSAAPGAVAAIWRELRALADGAATGKEVQQVTADLRDVLGRAGGAAVDAAMSGIATVTPMDVSMVMRQALPTALFTVPYGERAVLDGVTELGGVNSGYVPDGQVFPAKRFGFKRADSPRLVLTPDAVSRVDEAGAVTVRRSEAILLDHWDGMCVVTGANLATVVVDPDRYAGADEAVRTILGWFEHR